MNAQLPNAEAFKSAMRAQWDRGAHGWNDESPKIRNWLADATRAMIAMADIRPGMRVLDVAAGAGDQTLDIATRVGPDGSVLATDLSPAILALCRENAHRAGHDKVETLAADGEALAVEEAGFDAAVSRLGLMFFPDPGKGLRAIVHALKPGRRFCSMVFSTPETNPCVAILVSTALRHAGLPPRDPYQPGGLLSLGRPGLIDELFHAAGFVQVATTRIDAPFRLPSVRDYLDFVRRSANPILQILERLDESARRDAFADIEGRLAAFNTADGWQGPNELLLTAGARP
jgi:SAM-dependent methyltransferase